MQIDHVLKGDTNLTKGEASQLHWFELLWALFELGLTHTKGEASQLHLFELCTTPSNFTSGTRRRSFSTMLWFELWALFELYLSHTQKKCNWSDQTYTFVQCTFTAKRLLVPLSLLTFNYLLPPPFLSHPPLFSSLCAFHLSLPVNFFFCPH